MSSPTVPVPVPAPGLVPGLVAPRGHEHDELHDLTEVRAWARSRGYPVDESSRVPLEVLRTYRRVHAA